MTVTATNAVPNVVSTYDISLGTASATGVINVGDPLIYSGVYVLASVISAAAQKASAAGIAIQSNPTYDAHGRIATATALQYVRQGILRVSGASAAWIMGSPAYPGATGSGVAAPTGLTGVGALWSLAVKAATSGATFSTGFVSVVGVHAGAAGSAQLDILLTPPRPDYY